MTNETIKDKIPEEFTKITRDFVNDIITTFPEYEAIIHKWWKPKSVFDYIENIEDRDKAHSESEIVSAKFFFKFCQKKYPARFCDILYQNEEIFKDNESTSAKEVVDTEFLPRIHFKDLWQLDISKTTRDTIWKYLQLILFAVVNSLENKEAFGDSEKLFESVNTEEFKSKLEETLNQMQNLFDVSGNVDSNIKMENIPNADKLHEHLSGILDGKLGKLAKELAEETASNLNMDMDNATDMKDVFNKLIKNPTKLMGLVKNVGDKLDSRIKSGEIKESEIIAEASELMKKMKDMPGMDNIQSMLNKMGMGGMDLGAMGMGGGKVNMGAMQSQMDRNMKNAQLKERLRAKVDANKLSKAQVFSTGDKVEKTLRGTQPPLSNDVTNNPDNNIISKEKHEKPNKTSKKGKKQKSKK